MTTNLSYQKIGDIGGPMEIGEGYRWNVPIVTYGFDKSFIDYFGKAGVVAVEQAIKILNALPTASRIKPKNYPLDTARMNYSAQAQNIIDLKSVTLCLLLEQMGLAAPSRYTWTLRRWDPMFCPF